MGNTACQGALCFKRAEYTCDCSNKVYCHTCFSRHMQQGSSIIHNAIHLHPHSELKKQLILNRLKYYKPDGSTEIFEGKLGDKQVGIKMQYFFDFGCLNRKQEEATLQRCLRHKNICKCLKSYLDETFEGGYKFVIVMEYGLRDLEDEIRNRAINKTSWKEEELFDHFTQLIGALAVMQQNNFSHRDIKPANILVFPDNLLKLADFGLSIQEEDLLATQEFQVVGTVLYLSPALKQAYIDIWDGKNTNAIAHHNPFKSDVFSLGLTFLYMASLSPPVSLNSNIEGTQGLRRRIKSSITSLKTSSRIQYVLEAMLEVEEEGRMDFLELRDWIQQINILDLDETLINSISQLEKTSIESQSVLRLSLSEELYYYINQDSLLTSDSPSLSPKEILMAYASEHILPEDMNSLFERIIKNEFIEFYHYPEILLPVEAQHLGNFLCYMSDLTVLELSGCLIGDQGMKMLSSGLANCKNLKNLSLGKNKIGVIGADYLSNAISSLENLNILRLWSNCFCNEGVTALVKNFLNLSNLQELYLADNQIEFEGVEYLCTSLPSSLLLLSLSDNPIGDLGARFLSEALLKLIKLKNLYLENSKIGETGVQYLEKYIQPSLVSIRLDMNNLPQSSVSKLKSKYPRLKIMI